MHTKLMEGHTAAIIMHRLTKSDLSASAALMSIISHVFDPYQKLIEGHTGLNGKKMVLRPRNFIVNWTLNPHLVSCTVAMHLHFLNSLASVLQPRDLVINESIW